MIQQRTSKLLLVAHSHVVSKRLMQGILSAFSNEKNENFLKEINNNCLENDIIIFQHPMFITNKYYDCFIQVIFITYDILLKGDQIEQNIEQIKQKYSFRTIDGIFFLNKVLSSTKILGFNEYISVCDLLIQLVSPNLQGVIFDREKDIQINQSMIEKEEEGLQNFIEPIYEDFDQMSYIYKDQPLNQAQDQCSQGLQRIIEIIECNMWSQMVFIYVENIIKIPKGNAEEKKTLEDKQNFQGQTQNQTQKNKLNLHQQSNDDDIKEDDFAMILQEMKNLKENSDGNIDDTLRKQKAEDIMQQLMKACNFDDDFDEMEF